MKRSAALLAALVLAGCGGGDPPPDDRRSGPGPEKTATPDQVERALKELEDSDLPEDARRELEEAARLLEEAPEP